MTAAAFVGANSLAECCGDCNPQPSGCFYPGSSTRGMDVPCVSSIRTGAHRVAQLVVSPIQISWWHPIHHQQRVRVALSIICGDSNSQGPANAQLYLLVRNQEPWWLANVLQIYKEGLAWLPVAHKHLCMPFGSPTADQSFVGEAHFFIVGMGNTHRRHPCDASPLLLVLNPNSFDISDYTWK